MAAIDRRLAEQYPAEEKERKSQLVPLHEWLVGDVRSALLVLFGTVGLVLLIACANFASLLMMRAVAERRELVIRAALGAGRGRLIRKTLTESALLSVLGGAAGLLFAKLGTSMLLTLRPEELARLSGIHMDTRVLLFVLVISVLTGIVFGMAPVWIAARTDVAGALKESGRSTTASTMGNNIRKISGHIGTGGCLGAVSGSRFVDQRILTVALDEPRFQFRERNDDVSPIVHDAVPRNPQTNPVPPRVAHPLEFPTGRAGRDGD